MTTITINTDLGGNNAGDTINVTPGVAHYLTSAGLAEETKTPRKTSTKPKADPETD